MLSYISAGQKYLVSLALDRTGGPGKSTATKALTRAPRNFIFIIDRSGSMTWTLSSVIDYVLGEIKNLQDGDTVTIIWFSSQGLHRTLVERWTYSDGDYPAFERQLDPLRESVALTCFSESLFDAVEVVTNQDGPFAVVFLTDGYPVVSDYRREIAQIEKALDLLRVKAESVMFVAYGPYPNRELLSDMAQRVGGILVSARNAVDFGESLSRFAGSVSGSSKMSVHLPFAVQSGDIVFTVEGRDVAQYQPDPKGNILVSPGTAHVYALTDQKPNYAHPISNGNAQHMETALYAAALILTQRGKAGDALATLSATGDVALMDNLMVMTAEEFISAEKALEMALAGGRYRHTRGRNMHYLPPRDAYSLFDVLDDLVADPDAYFYPVHPDFRYHARGVKAIVPDDAPTFVRSPLTKCSFMGEDGEPKVIFASERVNISIKAWIGGMLTWRDKKYKDYNLPAKFKTGENRTYTIVGDGVLHLTTIPVSLGETLFSKLQRHGVIAAHETWEPDQIYVLNLRAVPVANRAMADPFTSAVPLVDLVAQEDKIGAQLKVWKELLERVQPREERKQAAFKELYGEKGAEYLLSHYLKPIPGGTSFDLKTTPGESEDVRFAPRFVIKHAGWSSPPKVSEVEERMAPGSKKKLNAPGEVMAGELRDYQSSLTATLPADAQVRLLDRKVKELKAEQYRARRAVQRAKAAILLARSWPDDLPRNVETAKNGQKKITGEIVTSQGEFEFVLDTVEDKY